MIKFIRLCLFIVSINLSYAQVGITKKSEIDIHQHAILQLDGEDNGEYRGLLLPTVNEYNDLPKKLPSEADAEMTGLLFYDKDLKIPFVYTGEKWVNEAKKEDYKANKSRFYTNAVSNNDQEVVCGGLLVVICGEHEGLKFDREDYNNLGIERGTASIKYGAITYDYPNAKFTITEEGVYEVMVYSPTRLAGVLDLTGGPRYELYYHYKDASGNQKETKLSTFAPASYSILGIGGNSNASAYTRVTLRMNVGDYIVARIQSPGGGLGIVSTLTAQADGTESNPREIIFTKISD